MISPDRPLEFVEALKKVCPGLAVEGFELIDVYKRQVVKITPVAYVHGMEVSSFGMFPALYPPGSGGIG